MFVFNSELSEMHFFIFDCPTDDHVWPQIPKDCKPKKKYLKNGWMTFGLSRSRNKICPPVIDRTKSPFHSKNPFQNMLIIIARSPCVFSSLPPSPTFHYHADMVMIPVFKKHRALNRWWPPRKLCFEMALNSGWKREQPRFRRVSAHIFTSPFAMFGDHTHAPKELLLKIIMFSAPENSAKE